MISGRRLAAKVSLSRAFVKTFVSITAFEIVYARGMGKSRAAAQGR